MAGAVRMEQEKGHGSHGVIPAGVVRMEQEKGHESHNWTLDGGAHNEQEKERVNRDVICTPRGVVSKVLVHSLVAG